MVLLFVKTSITTRTKYIINMSKQIHWFPGHMKKALNNINDSIKLVDVVIELFDARCPASSINAQLEESVKNKKKLIILTKPDLADPSITKLWVERLKKENDLVVDLDLTKGSATNEIIKLVSILGKSVWDKQIAKGMKPQPLKTMIIGIPNVGKSSLINRLSKRKAAGVQNKPGFTKGEQWIKVSDQFLLLDTPGVLPMNFEDKKQSVNLALIGSIREDILPTTDLVIELIKYLKAAYPNSLKERFDIDEIDDYESVINKICLNRKLVKGNGELDIMRAENLLLHEFKNGLLGRISLEK